MKKLTPKFWRVTANLLSTFACIFFSADWLPFLAPVALLLAMVALWMGKRT